MESNQKLRLLTLKEAAEYLRMHKGSLYRLLENGKIDIQISTLFKIFEEGLGKKLGLTIN